jgi:hypothetical protein
MWYELPLRFRLCGPWPAETRGGSGALVDGLDGGWFHGVRWVGIHETTPRERHSSQVRGLFVDGVLATASNSGCQQRKHPRPRGWGCFYVCTMPGYWPNMVSQEVTAPITSPFSGSLCVS